MTGPRPARRARERGFTLIEVMIAVLLAMIGLLGTLAVQQTLMNATMNGNDAAVASRLATQAMEEYGSRVLAAGSPVVDQLSGAVTAGWSKPVYLNARGESKAAFHADHRFRREVQVTNRGVGLPYNISVRVSYRLAGGEERTIRIDMERYKAW